MSNHQSVLALTIGEPSGIGPDITIAAWQKLRKSGPAFAFLGPADVISDRAACLGEVIATAIISEPREAANVFAKAIPVVDPGLDISVERGKPDGRNAKAVLRSIEAAVALTLSGGFEAIVTNPIQKAVLYGAGFAFQGHTDFIAELCRSAGHPADPVMMLSTQGLRTIPVTVHIPLKDVPGALTKDGIVRQVRIAEKALREKLGIIAPRIGVTGLNPHAGEGGALGREEFDIIQPAIDELEKSGVHVEGPLPADTVFHEQARESFDLIVCMYHDQALIPVKTIGFHDGVNTTLGLPLVRTSPDHGTALSLAGTGKANPSSLIAALKLAAAMTADAGQRR